MKKVILCINLKQAARAKKLDSASLGAILAPRLFGLEINSYAQNGVATYNNKPAHVIIHDESATTIDDLQFKIMQSLLKNEAEWPQIVVIADEKINQEIKSVFPPGDVDIFSPKTRDSLSMYDVYKEGEAVFAALISDRHLYA